MTTSEARRHVKILAALLLTCGTLLGVELALQIAYRCQSGHWLWQDDAFRVFYVQRVPDARDYSLRPGYRDAEKSIEVDANGFRVIPGASPPSGHRPLLVTLGDSVPFGAGVCDEETYGARVAKALSGEWDVINAGVPSYNVRQSIARLKIDVIPRAWPTVVTLQAANDISLLSYYRDQWRPDLTWATGRFFKELTAPSELEKLALLHYAVQLAGTARHATSRPVPSGYGGYGFHDDTRMVASVRADLEDFVVYCKNQGIRLILMPVDPFYYQTANRWRNPSLKGWKQFSDYIEDFGWDRLIDNFNAMLEDVARRHAADGVSFLDVRRVMDASDREQMFLDFIHYTPLGNQRVADAIVAHLRR